MILDYLVGPMYYNSQHSYKIVAELGCQSQTKLVGGREAEVAVMYSDNGGSLWNECTLSNTLILDC